MKQLCPYHEKCRFFNNYGSRISRMWKNLVALYCRGGLMPFCWRHQRYGEGELCPNEDVMPNGETIPEPFKALP